MTLDGHVLKIGECSACWRTGPDKCANCGSRLHTEFGDYVSEDSYYLEKACEGCEEPELDES